MFEVGDIVRTAYFGLEVEARIESLPPFYYGVTLLQDGWTDEEDTSVHYSEGDFLYLDEDEIVEVVDA